MDFELTILGAGAALPARGRFPTSQHLVMGGRHYLIDCGEGTQERLREAGINTQRIERIFISHMHGDHYLGLMGLISSMHLLGRKKALHVHAPESLKAIIDLQLRASNTYLRYTLEFQPLEHKSGVVLVEDEKHRVTSIALKHRIPTTGFRFEETSRLRKLIREKVELIPHYKRKSIQQGEDLELENGRVIPNAELTLGEPVLRAYAYCSDTAYDERILEYIQGVSLLYHESTFADDLLARAKETEHSTASQAATIASKAEVGTLLLGHFSSRYKSADILLEQATPIFANTHLSVEGRTYAIGDSGVREK